MSIRTNGLPLVGDANVSNVQAGKTFSSLVAGVGKTGSLANQGQLTITPDSAAHDYPGGSYTGVHMNAMPGKRYANSSVTVPASSSLTVTLGWAPKVAVATNTAYHVTATNGDRGDASGTWQATFDNTGTIITGNVILTKNATGFIINQNSLAEALTYNYYAYET